MQRACRGAATGFPGVLARPRVSRTSRWGSRGHPRTRGATGAKTKLRKSEGKDEAIRMTASRALRPTWKHGRVARRKDAEGQVADRRVPRGGRGRVGVRGDAPQREAR